jgi:hypothetical protein
LRRLLVRCGYEALGCPDNWAGVVVFNPSRVLAGVLRHRCESSQALRAVGPAELAHEASRALIELATGVWAGPLDQRSEQIVQFQRWLVEHSRRCLQGFCIRHGLPTDAAEVAEALSEKTASGPHVEYRSW